MSASVGSNTMLQHIQTLLVRLKLAARSTDERQEINTIFAEEGVPTHSETSQITEPFLPAR